MSGLAARIEERLLVPTYGSRRPFASIAAHRSLALPLQLSGPVRLRTVAADLPIRVAGIGRDKLIGPFVARLLGAGSVADAGPRRGLWSPAALAGLEADLVVAEVHRWMAPRFRRAGWIIVPDAVRWTGELSAVPGPTPPRSLREDLRKIARQGFTLEQSRSAADWELFATRMVAPQAVARFGDQAWIPSPRLLRELARAGTLHLVRLEGRMVGGACSVPAGDTLWLPLLGVLDGDPALFRRGASLAALAPPIAWARAQGYRRVDAGRTGPFLRDGVLQLKRKWSLQPTADPLAHVMAVLARSAAARAAFGREPVLIEDQVGVRPFHGTGP